MSDYGHMDFTKAILPFAIVCAVLGWGVIELLLWLVSLAITFIR